VEEALLDSEDEAEELSLLELDAVSDFESDEDLESVEALESDDEELSLLLLSIGGLGRP
tara:strand:- start:328 stop:504 length:177 start_codon:yes stop_codon:yes gene_type:complete